MEYHLAPMKNITCWALRASIPCITDSYSEMINLEELLKEQPRSIRKLDFFPLYNQFQWLQVITNNPKHLKLLPIWLINHQKQEPERMNIYGININIGCPDPHIIAAGQGAELLNHPKLVRKMISEFLTTNHTYKISIKIRLGINHDNMVKNSYLALIKEIKTIRDSRLYPIIIHFKHAEQNSDSPCHWELLDSILEMKTPIIINGNIKSPMDIKKIRRSIPYRLKSNWDEFIKGIMIGREIFQNPLCFCQFQSEKVKNNEYYLSKFHQNINKYIKEHFINPKIKNNLKKYFPITNHTEN